MTQPRVRLLPEQWPVPDAAAWRSAMRPADGLFDDGGAGSRIAPATHVALETAMSDWLRFLKRHDPDASSLPLLQRATPDCIRAFANQLATTNSPTSIGNHLSHLSAALRLIAPETDWAWLADLARRFRAMAKPRHKPTPDLVQLNAAAMNELALQLHGTPSRLAALAARDALIVAILTEAPIRRRNLAMIRIGSTLQRSAHGWRLYFPEEMTKSGRALDYPLSNVLSDLIDGYLTNLRPLVLRARKHEGLFPSSKGVPLQDGALYDAVMRWTRQHTGTSVNLHAFRHAAGTFLARYDPVNVKASRDLLGHVKLDTTQKHYIAAGTIQAAKALQNAIAQKAKNKQRD